MKVDYICSIYIFILTVFELWPHHTSSQVFGLLFVCLFSGFGVWFGWGFFSFVFFFFFFLLRQWLKIGLCGILFLSMTENFSLIVTMKNMKCCFHKVPENAVTSQRIFCICQEVVLCSTLPWWFLSTTMFGCLYPIFKLLLQLLSFVLLAISFPYESQFWNGTLTFSTSQYNQILNSLSDWSSIGTNMQEWLYDKTDSNDQHFRSI